MNLTETDRLLTIVSNVDNRKVDDATVLIWHEIIGSLPFADCVTAVTRHFAESSEYLMPVHIVRGAKEVDRERRRDAREARETELAAIEAADPTRRDRSDAVRALIAELREKLPDGDPDKLRYGAGHWRQVREARERQENAEPNPHYDPKAVIRLREMSNDGETP